MKNVNKVFQKHQYLICVAVILLAAIFLRFYNYSGRWGLAYDQAHDAVIARYAIENFKFPPLGPFSSAGPYQTGGEWYWIIILGQLFFLPSVMTPWVFMTLLYVAFVYFIMYTAEKLHGRTYALIVGVLAAVSTAQITQSTNLTNQSPQAILSLAAIFFALRFLKNRKLKDLFFLGLFVSTAASVHLQGAALASLLFFTLLFSGIPRWTEIPLLFAGLLIPWLPVLVVDAQNNFFNTGNMLQYYLHDQYKISLDTLGRRWLTYGGVFWPNVWGFTTGGSPMFGYIAMIGVVAATLVNFLKKQLPKEWYVLLLSFAGMMFILRYTRTPLFESYIVFAHPIMLMITGWVIYTLYKRYAWIGLLMLVLFTAGSLWTDLKDITHAENRTAILVSDIRKNLLLKYPGRKFAVYDYNFTTKDKSVPLVLFLDEKDANDEKGMRVGFMSGGETHHSVIVEKDGYKIVNLDEMAPEAFAAEPWGSVSPYEVYRSTQEWYTYKK